MTFEAIKQCAINKDVKGLMRIIAPTPLRWLDYIFSPPPYRISIDARKIGNCHLTSAGELAREGNLEAVEFLRQHGASVNQIAYGFALGGHTKEVERYRKTFGASVNAIAYGFAQSGHAEEADRYQNEYGASVHQIAFGFAFGGHDEQAERYRTKHRASVEYIAAGFAQGGHMAKAEAYRIEFDVPLNIIARGFALCGNVDVDRYGTDLDSIRQAIIRGLAQGGHTAQAYRYRIELHSFGDGIALGFALSGYSTDADRFCRSSETCVNSIAFAFALAGHVADADRYRTKFGANVNIIARGFAFGGHAAQVTRYRTEFGASINTLPEAFTHGGHSFEPSMHKDLGIDHLPTPPANKPTTSEILLKDYVATFKKRPITILENYKYPEKFNCPILQEPPPIPVRIMGLGPLDYHAVMQTRETYKGSGERSHPLLQGVKFKITDIAPDTVTRDELNEFASAFLKSKAVSTSNAVSSDAQLILSRIAGNRAAHNIDAEIAATSIQNSI